ncbi:uncharacterized protein Tco025E_09818 [Trypanosoma conorhini]|uniref:Uncharacterized protein n=1 Tax=Trypanosoma conorhini TaxID=83891 RepID=A0A3R7KK77_9TRYP|nr:uncharacterized protein Tco025E_09818 [Trypanosoma conorhini]RNE96080.1 hypothetical protein Tco025E_09818 [Trypanosoma conorhini]
MSILPLHFNITRNRLERVYASHAPELLASVDLALAAYEGSEDVLFRLLQTKYGTELCLFASIYSLAGAHADAQEAQKCAEVLVELRKLCASSSYDAQAARLEVGFPRD